MDDYNNLFNELHIKYPHIQLAMNKLMECYNELDNEDEKVEFLNLIYQYMPIYYKLTDNKITKILKVFIKSL